MRFSMENSATVESIQSLIQLLYRRFRQVCDKVCVERVVGQRKLCRNGLLSGPHTML
jgi:hypothetical protein